MLKQNHWQRFIVAVVAIAIVQIACGQQYTRIRQNGYSMLPNFTDGDVFKIKEVPLADLRRGDLVMVENNGNLLLKRLVGLPNETVSIHNGIVFINGLALDEPYEVVPPDYKMDELELDEEEYFVLGDNRPDSSDSHLWGPAKGSAIKGEAIPE